MKRLLLGIVLGLPLGVNVARPADAPGFARTEDVIYGRKFGTALTMDVFAPKSGANGAGIIWAVSGGWKSDHGTINPIFITEFLSRGYAVFAVVHGSQPKFTIPEIIDDMNRAARYIRYHAKDYHIEPDRIGVTGASAGGHLSLMLGTDGKPGDPKAKDPVDRVSSRVQCVACFFPPTDFLNFGKKGYVLNKNTARPPFKASFDFSIFDPNARLFVPIAQDKLEDMCRRISPISHVTAASAPCLIVQGDVDDLVPLQQAEVFIAKCKELKVPAELIIKKGAGHGWPTILSDTKVLADWFDKYIGHPKNGEKPSDR
jgi:acetyl esterase/lipase